MTIEDVVDAFWCEALGLDRDTLRTPGVHVVGGAPGIGGDRTFILRIGDACVIAVSEDRRSRVADIVDGRSADEVYDRGFAARLGPEGGRVLGPSWHGYVDRARFRVAPGPSVRRITSSDAEAVARLEAAVEPEEWAEGGFVPFPGATWGTFEGADLASLGNMTGWNGEDADVGLLTHPSHRGRGLGGAVASAMTDQALERMAVVRYRALTTNAASLRVAKRLGFVGYGQNIVVRSV